MTTKEAETIAYLIESEMQNTLRMISKLESVEDRFEEALELLRTTGFDLAEYYATLFTQ